MYEFLNRVQNVTIGNNGKYVVNCTISANSTVLQSLSPVFLFE